jgi:hypothetical protein
MKPKLDFSIQPQPTDSTCGPTCLHAVYTYWEDAVSLSDTIAEVGQLSKGGTLAVALACHALGRDYDATIHTYNLQLFDPSWFTVPNIDLAAKLRQQLDRKCTDKSRSQDDLERLRFSTETYLRFLALGGRVRMPILDEELIVETLTRGVPILCGLSASYLYGESRERSQLLDGFGKTSVPDDIGGDPVGHFVVLYGFDRNASQVLIADPLSPNPMAGAHQYAVSLSTVIAAIFLGILTYDANLLTITPRAERRGDADGGDTGH